MRFSNFMLLVSVYIRASFGGVLEVIDHGGQCLIWSDDNFGCTGYTTPLGLLDGDDCSKLSEVVNGNRKPEAIVRVNACGTEYGQPAAWIVVNDKGIVTFFNQNGDRSACALDNGLKVGSQCSASTSVLTSSSSSSSSSASSFSSDLGSTSSVLGSPTPSLPGKPPALASSDKPICRV